MNKSFKKEFLNAVLIGVTAVVIGLVTNAVRTSILTGMVEKGTIAPTTANKYTGVNLVDDWSHNGWPGLAAKPDGDHNGSVEIKWIDYTEAVNLMEEGRAVFVDARPPDHYAEAHIPGAISWPFNDFERYHAMHKENISPDTRIVVYCEGGACDESNSLAQDLLISGYQDISIYRGGISEWEDLGMPVDTGSDE